MGEQKHERWYFWVEIGQMHEKHIFHPLGARWRRNLQSQRHSLTITASTSTFPNVPIAGKAQFPKCPNVSIVGVESTYLWSKVVISASACFPGFVCTSRTSFQILPFSWQIWRFLTVLCHEFTRSYCSSDTFDPFWPSCVTSLPDLTVLLTHLTLSDRPVPRVYQILPFF